MYHLTKDYAEHEYCQLEAMLGEVLSSRPHNTHITQSLVFLLDVLSIKVTIPSSLKCVLKHHGRVVVG